MNQERFDDLAKGLATKRFSRRQVLKSFVASAIAGTFSAFVTWREAAAAPSGVSCDPSKCLDDADAEYESRIELCQDAVLECTDDPHADPRACGALFFACRTQAEIKHDRAESRCIKHAECKGACQICVNGTCQSECSAPKTCVDGACACPRGQQACGQSCCGSGQSCCNGACKDTQGNDPQNCGSCGNVCPSGECDSGVCTDPGCDPPCGPCETCEAVPDPVGGTNFTCVPIPDAKPCGDACCGSCQICDGGLCRNCNQNERCENGTCVPIDCGDPCLVMEDGQCVPVTCPSCQECDQQSGTCVPIDCGDPCLECQNDQCVLMECGPCQECSDGSCVSTCDECSECVDGSCASSCGTCEECVAENDPVGGVTFRCVAKQCEPPKTLNPETCECEQCPEGSLPCGTSCCSTGGNVNRCCNGVCCRSDQVCMDGMCKDFCTPGVSQACPGPNGTWGCCVDNGAGATCLPAAIGPVCCIAGTGEGCTEEQKEGPFGICCKGGPPPPPPG